MAWKPIWTLLFLISLHERSNAVYFPMGDVELTIPDSGALRKPLMTLQALPSLQGPLDTVSYNFNGSHLLRIEPVNGTMTFSNVFYEQHDHNAVTMIAGSVIAKTPSGDSAQTTVRLALESRSQALNCDSFVKELCFWKSVKYKLLENRGPAIIGSLSSPYLVDMCRTHHLTYSLLENGTEQHLSIVPSPVNGRQWLLRSLKPFERDIARADHHSRGFGVGAAHQVGVRCSVTSGTGTSATLHHVNKTLRIEVLDEDDNVPLIQSRGEVVQVSISNSSSLQSELDKLSRHLVFIDLDSIDVNNYTVQLLNDTLGLFKVSYTKWDEDRYGEHQTVIHFRLSSVPNARIPDPSYTVVLQINDTSLLPGNGESTTNTTIRFVKPEVLPPPANIRKNILYDETARIFRTAAFLARVTQPKELPTSFRKFRVKMDSSGNKEGIGAFNVTVKGGIVYVQNIEMLQLSSTPIRLEIQWEDSANNKTLSDGIIVQLERESNPSCTNKSNIDSHRRSCSMMSNAKSCNAFCGLGTGGNSSVYTYAHSGLARCMWQGEKKPSMNQINVYSTCTPDTSTCPDKVCDPLEELHHLICPQDCVTGQDLWWGSINRETGRGIVKAGGVCTCDEHGKCSCRMPIISKKTSTTLTTTVLTTTESLMVTSSNSSTDIPVQIMQPNVSRRTADIRADMSSCGSLCVIGIVTGSLFLVGALATIVACWRSSHREERSCRDRKYAHNSNPMNGIPSDYINRSIPSADTLLLNFDMNSSLTLINTAPKNNSVVDPKWEFPREKLRIEQTLGEGEFGRVLRARAFEIAGLPGYTTVAVKTLKEDARETELADLMSEYQLLKEVSHPNVIKLLGASTLPGGPVYLIIEFAEYGSLRNYLRRSRHLESEGQTPCSGAMFGESEPTVQPTCKITPRDILSFAWQISKGMAYLNDMKLVHRDLAARNVLLATEMVCKISDFGLTRDVYEDDTYLKRTRGRVPVKWMAPESLADHIYNSKSDVWSFGILLWELVTLGASPYPGVAVQNLFHLLRSGYRMERPDNCSPAFYKIMRMCWAEEPGERPTFRTLTLKLETMLADGIDYLDLNPRVVHNRTYFTSIPDTLITPDEVDDVGGYGNLTLMQADTVNLQSYQQNTKKCAQVDKLQVLWKKPESPKATNTRTYENEKKAQELNHYESPIKFRNKGGALKTPTNERPQSYIDMAGATNTESETLLLSKSRDEIEKISKVTSL